MKTLLFSKTKFNLKSQATKLIVVAAFAMTATVAAPAHAQQIEIPGESDLDPTLRQELRQLPPDDLQKIIGIVNDPHSPSDPTQMTVLEHCAIACAKRCRLALLSPALFTLCVSYCVGQCSVAPEEY